MYIYHPPPQIYFITVAVQVENNLHVEVIPIHETLFIANSLTLTVHVSLLFRVIGVLVTLNNLRATNSKP